MPLHLKQTLDLHRKVNRPSTIGLRHNGKMLRLTSSSASGSTSLWSNLPGDSPAFEAVVDFLTFSALVKGLHDATLSTQDGRLHVKCGRNSGDLPIQNENQARLPKSQGVKLGDADAQWLCDGITRVTLSDLDRTGLLSAECDTDGWRLSCVDDVHGACMFGGNGKAKIKFSLTPTDAEALGAVVAASEEAVTVGFADSTLVVSSGPHTVALPSVDGSAQTREMIDSGNVLVSQIKAEELREALNVINPVASAKDAAPVTITLKEKAVVLSATSPAGSVQSKISAKSTKALEFRVSHALLSALADRAIGTTKLSVRVEEKEVTRITLGCKGDLHLVMLTST